jgi:hypothetical protein
MNNIKNTLFHRKKKDKAQKGTSWKTHGENRARVTEREKCKTSSHTNTHSHTQSHRPRDLFVLEGGRKEGQGNEKTPNKHEYI